MPQPLPLPLPLLLPLALLLRMRRLSRPSTTLRGQVVARRRRQAAEREAAAGACGATLYLMIFLWYQAAGYGKVEGLVLVVVAAVVVEAVPRQRKKPRTG